MIDALPRAKALLADRDYNADWLRATLTERGIAPCILSKVNRKMPIPTTPRSIASVTESRTCSANSRTGAASHPPRPMRPHSHIRHLHRRNRRLLAQSSRLRRFPDTPRQNMTQLSVATIWRGRGDRDDQGWNETGMICRILAQLQNGLHNMSAK